MWGAGDPGNMLAYKKPMRLASDVDLTPLIRTCNRQHLHQVVEGSVRSGARKKAGGAAQFQQNTQRNHVHEWVKLMRSTLAASSACKGAFACR